MSRSFSILKCLAGLLILHGVVVTTNAQSNCQCTNPLQCTADDIKRLFDCEWEDQKDRRIDEIIDDIDVFQIFEDNAGITVGAVIAIFIVLIIVPNLVIMLLIFLCCYCCKCGAFYRGNRDRTNVYYGQNAGMASQSGVRQGPSVPPKPQVQPQSPQQSSTGMWPWGKDSQPGAWNRNQGQGQQNPGYRSNY